MLGIWARLTAWLQPASGDHVADNRETPSSPLPCPVFRRWRLILDPHPQQPKVLEIFMQGDRQVVCFRMTPGEGEWTKFYMFFVGPPGSDCPDLIISAGSYRYTNQHRTPETRRYHLDLYDADQHVTIWIKDYLPAYDTLRQEAVKLLEGMPADLGPS
ncbi:MAG TPA: hypothetical protein VNS22_28050 [Geminicoccus sp.]|uniref:hypothetical protein n=1 Tax=Geminicoccus sp. TaxID=2024832 RepID=UPI002D0DD881|nr:hypothetical protein [Geminicoccus sp.]HWL72212.1 hypothetical protein [Geminicoccus sp.]